MEYRFENLVDIKQIQQMCDHLHGIIDGAIAILNPDGEILVASGWQKICTHFHRVNAQSLENCRKSDSYIKNNLSNNTPLAYRCRNGLWDISLPLFIEEEHIATLFFGQFFYDDDKTDEAVFRKQAKKYGFAEEEYLKNLREVPVLSHAKVDSFLRFFRDFAQTLAESGYNRMIVKKEKVDELLEKEHAVREANSFLDAIISNLPHGIQIYDYDGNALMMNKIQKEYLGIDDSLENIGPFNILNNTFAVVHGLDKSFREAREGKIVSHVREYDFNVKHDSWIHRNDKCFFETIFFSIRDDSGEVTNIISLVDDVTARKSIEERLNQSEEKYRRLTEGIPGVVYIVSLEQGGVYYSMGVERFLGYDRDVLYENPYLWRDSISEDDRLEYSNILKHFYGEENFEIQYRIKNKNGEWMWVLDRPISRIERDGETYIEGLAIDITELVTIRERLSELIAARDKFISIIGHDLKGPMGSMTSVLKQMSELIRERDLENLEMLRNELEKTSERSLGLLMDILDWGRSKTGALILKVEQVDLEAITEEAVSIYIERMKEKGISCSIKIDNGIPLSADKNMIKTVIRNLISNAVKFTSSGGEIHISANKEEGKIIFSVRDTGIGIKKDKLNKLFHLGNHFSTTGTDDEKGSGIGLILCQEFIEKHHGKIQVESIEGKGSVFTFIIPALQADM